MTDLVPFFDGEAIATDTRRYLERSLSENTLKAYRTDFELFMAWGGSLPTSAETVAAYLSCHAEILAISTLQRRIISIAKYNTLNGHPDPTKNDLVKMTMRGVRRCHGEPQKQASPIMKDDLIVMLSNMPDTLKAKRDSALLMLGFCGAFRRSELIALRCTDIDFTHKGMIVTLRRSKTDKFGEGRKIAIPNGKGRICPVASVRLWMECLKASDSFLFRSIGKGGRISDAGLSARSVSIIIKEYIRKIGLNPEIYSGHSLRSGLCTSAAQAGISSWKIRQQTGHKSDTMLARYIRDGDLFTNNAAALF